MFLICICLFAYESIFTYLPVRVRNRCMHSLREPRYGVLTKCLVSTWWWWLSSVYILHKMLMSWENLYVFTYMHDDDETLGLNFFKYPPPCSLYFIAEEAILCLCPLSNYRCLNRLAWLGFLIPSRIFFLVE